MVEHLMTETGVSFGTSHIVIVHPAAPVASNAHEQFDINGVLQVGGEVRAIRSRAVKDEFSDYTLNIDIDCWTAIRTVVSNPQHRPVAILAWELRLLTDVPLDPPLPPVFTFAARA